ncbi:hypothetical protein ACFXJ8_15395 [Nonomuraea sp. NPDC059194]|uniref:hypothetical protein n=1 Tax=Nonomuraea sp. NPDC059194 TaxID=3346764 RepID=UPI0036BC3927
MTPEPLPTNVRIETTAYSVPAGYTGFVGYGARGGGHGRHRAGDRLGFRVDLAYVDQGEVVSRCSPMTVSATTPDILARIAGATVPSCYFPWHHYSTAGSWMSLRTG